MNMVMVYSYWSGWNCQHDLTDWNHYTQIHRCEHTKEKYQAKRGVKFDAGDRDDIGVLKSDGLRHLNKFILASISDPLLQGHSYIQSEVKSLAT